MTDNEEALDQILRNYALGEESKAFRDLHALADRVNDPWEKAWLKYNETLALVDMHDASRARVCFQDLERILALILNLPSSERDPTDVDVVKMIVRHAEIRILLEEEKESQPLRLIEDFALQFSEQLSLPQFKTLAEEVATLRGFFLGSAGRWKEAMTFLAAVTPPRGWMGQYCLYLGRCYYENKDYERAKPKLLEALGIGLETVEESEVHYVLGLTEYHLGDIRAAKREFESSLKNAAPSNLDDIWRWLAATSRALGLHAEAESYAKLRSDPRSKAN